MRRPRQRKGDSKGRRGTGEDKPQPDGRTDRRAVLGILVATFVGYFPALSAGFTNWDDDRFITKNPLFQGPVASYIWAALTQVQFQAYHPLHLLSYVPDRLLWPHHPGGFHALNLALYATALALAYYLLRRTVSVVPSVAAILLVGLSPLAVEPVAWIVGRKDVLALLFLFATLLVEDREPRTRRSLVLALGLATAACLAKTSAVVLPIVLFAWLRFARERPLRETLRRCAPFAVIALVFAVPVPLIWERNQMIPSSRPLPLVLDVLGTLGIYAGRVVAPLHLSPVYPGFLPGQGIAGLVVGAALLALVLFWRNLPGAAKFAAVGFVGCLLPVANITPVYFRFADRYALLALVVLAWPVAKALAWPRIRTLAVVVAPLLIAVELWATMQQASVWNDSLSLWQHAVAEQPRAIWAYLKLGETLREAKRYREAGAAYLQAGELDRGSVKGPAGLLRTVGEKAESEGKIPVGTCDAWESVIAKPGFDARRMSRLVDTLNKYDCRGCAAAMLWLGLRMFPQSDASLVSFAKNEIERGRKDTALFYLGEVRDPRTAGWAEVTKLLRETSSSP
jgi:hypothetical protein